MGVSAHCKNPATGLGWNPAPMFWRDCGSPAQMCHLGDARDEGEATSVTGHQMVVAEEHFKQRPFPEVRKLGFFFLYFL